MTSFKYIFSMISMMGILLISCDKPTQQSEQVTTNSNSDQVSRIVYIDIDTLLNRYELYKDRKASLEEQSKAAENSLGSKIEAFQKRVAKLQQEFGQAQQNAANIAPIDLKKLEDKFVQQQQNLAKEEESLMKQRDNAARDLDSKLQELQIDLQEKIDQHLDKVAEEKGYDFVLMRGSGGSVMYGRKSLDITEETLTVLNDEYSKTQKK